CLLRLVTLNSLCSVFFNVPPTSAIYTLSLHDALPISAGGVPASRAIAHLTSLVSWHESSNHNLLFIPIMRALLVPEQLTLAIDRSEEHTSELQSRGHLVCRLLLEKKKTKSYRNSNVET